MKNKIYYITGVLILLFAGLTSCQKDKGTGKKFAYGTVNIKLYNLGDGPPLITCKFDGKTLGAVSNNGAEVKLQIPAEILGRLAFYRGKSDSLLIDTAVQIANHADVHYKLAFSTNLGIYGFINAPSVPVARDSSYVQLLNQLDPVNYSDPIDMELFILDGDTYETSPTGIVYKDIFRNKLYPHGFMSTVQPKGPDGKVLNAYYVVKFKDHRTGEYVYQPANGADWAQLVPDVGHAVILILTSDTDGNMQCRNIALDAL